MARNVTLPKGEPNVSPDNAATIFSASVEPAFRIAAAAAITTLYPTTEPRRGYSLNRAWYAARNFLCSGVAIAYHGYPVTYQPTGASSFIGSRYSGSPPRRLNTGRSLN